MAAWYLAIHESLRMWEAAIVTVDGLLLAGGAGRRLGAPKALVRDAEGAPWLLRAVDVLRAGGCGSVTVVLGASAEQARDLLSDEAATVVVARDWDEGMGASLRCGLASLPDQATSALVHLVDLPDVGPAVVRRLLAVGGGRQVLARATYGGRAGHPVVLGRDHWAGIAEVATGDRGARDYLTSHQVAMVECGDLASGRDVDVMNQGQRICVAKLPARDLEP